MSEFCSVGLFGRLLQVFSFPDLLDQHENCEMATISLWMKLEQLQHSEQLSTFCHASCVCDVNIEYLLEIPVWSIAKVFFQTCAMMSPKPFIMICFHASCTPCTVSLGILTEIFLVLDYLMYINLDYMWFSLIKGSYLEVAKAMSLTLDWGNGVYHYSHG